MNLFRRKKCLINLPPPEFWEALIEIHRKWDLKVLAQRHFLLDDVRGDDFSASLHVLDRWMDIAIESGWTE